MQILRVENVSKVYGSKKKFKTVHGPKEYKL